jgi:hypothetical protein
MTNDWYAYFPELDVKNIFCAFRGPRIPTKVIWNDIEGEHAYVFIMSPGRSILLLAIPYSVEHVTINNVVDLRQPPAQRWLYTFLTTAGSNRRWEKVGVERNPASFVDSRYRAHQDSG